MREYLNATSRQTKDGSATATRCLGRRIGGHSDGDVPGAGSASTHSALLVPIIPIKRAARVVSALARVLVHSREAALPLPQAPQGG